MVLRKSPQAAHLSFAIILFTSQATCSEPTQFLLILSRKASFCHSSDHLAPAFTDILLIASFIYPFVISLFHPVFCDEESLESFVEKNHSIESYIEFQGLITLLLNFHFQSPFESCISMLPSANFCVTNPICPYCFGSYLFVTPIELTKVSQTLTFDKSIFPFASVTAFTQPFSTHKNLEKNESHTGFSPSVILL
jgi:hypothetical protein